MQERVFVGGGRSDVGNLFYLPTVIDRVQPEMSIFKEEIFGPVAALISFESEADAVRLANQTEYGLAAYFYTQDLGRAWRVGEALEYGMVGLNTGLLSSASARSVASSNLAWGARARGTGSRIIWN